MGAKAAQLRALYGVLNLFACTVALAMSLSLCLSLSVSVSRFVSSSFSLYWFFSFPSIGTPWSAEMGTPARASSSQFVRRRCLGVYIRVPARFIGSSPSAASELLREAHNHHQSLHRNGSPPAAFVEYLTTPRWFLARPEERAVMLVAFFGLRFSFFQRTNEEKLTQMARTQSREFCHAFSFFRRAKLQFALSSVRKRTFGTQERDGKRGKCEKEGN